MIAPLTTAMDIFVVANDARFLFKKLRRSPEAERLSVACTTEDLLQWLAEHSHASPTTVEEVVDVYVHLVAVYLQGDTAVDQLLSWPIPQVQWGPQFVQLMREATATSTSHSTIDPYKFAEPKQRREISSPFESNYTTRSTLPRQ